MKTVREMFQEDGQGSMMRLMSFLLVAAGIFEAIYPTLTKQSIDANNITLILGLIGSGLAGKLVQKSMEVKAEPTSKN